MPNDKRRGGRPWRRVRAYVLIRDRHLCQLRYPNICTTRALEVDHIETVHDNPARELDPTNLRAACVPCHKHRTATDEAPTTPASREW